MAADRNRLQQRVAPASRVVPGRRRFAWAGLFVAIAAIALGLHGSQVQAQQQLNQVFQSRAEVARQFVASYVRDIFDREQSVAAAQLADATISDAQFQAVAQAFGFTAAVVLDADGRALDILPSAPARIGANLAATYAHLRSAESGVPMLSHVVPSAALGRPVVAFAVPYTTPYGRRVFSGAFDVNATPVANYLNNAVPLSGVAIYLVDQQSGVVVADKSGARATPNSAPLSVQAPQLAQAASVGSEGTFSEGDHQRYFVQRDVLNAPWRIVLSVPSATLYAPLEGAATWAPWAIFAGLAVGAILFGRLLGRLQDSRGALAMANADLVLLARVDKLTGVYNRRHIEQQLDAFLGTAVRQRSAFSVLIVDVDHFKTINDTEGHASGDRALQCLASAIHLNLRPGDVFGRWGGEEFAVLVPGADAAAALPIAERLRQAAAAVATPSTSGRRLRLTVSIGVASAESGDTAATLVARADAALYRAKDSGRNKVVA